MDISKIFRKFALSKQTIKEMSWKKSKRRMQYEANKEAKVGEVIVCPICGEKLTKKSYQQAFCSTKCKDAYWNNKKDRHKSGYYSEYNQKHPERYERLIGLGFTTREREENYALYRYATDKEFRKYVNEPPFGCEAESMMCQVDLATQLDNFEGID